MGCLEPVTPGDKNRERDKRRRQNDFFFTPRANNTVKHLPAHSVTCASTWQQPRPQLRQNAQSGKRGPMALDSCENHPSGKEESADKVPPEPRPRKKKERSRTTELIRARGPKQPRQFAEMQSESKALRCTWNPGLREGLNGQEPNLCSSRLLRISSPRWESGH